MVVYMCVYFAAPDDLDDIAAKIKAALDERDALQQLHASLDISQRTTYPLLPKPSAAIVSCAHLAPHRASASRQHSTTRASDPSLAAVQTIRIASVNVHYFSDENLINNVERIRDLVKEHNADVVLLQEVIDHQVKTELSLFAEMLGMAYVAGFPTTLGNAILSRYPIDNAVTYT